MPPRVQGVQDAQTGLAKWYWDLPPITRYFATACLIVTVGCNLGWIPFGWIVLLWPRVLQRFEIWRLVTNFFFLGKLSFNFVIRLLWVFSYGVPLEKETYGFEPADYLYLFIVLGAGCLAVQPFTGLMANGIPLIMALIYVWARNFPDQQVSLYGLVKVQSFYLPFAFAGISLLLGQSIVPDIVGIVVGHAYWFLRDVLPRQQPGIQLLNTPAFLKNWARDIGLTPGGAPAAAPAAPAASRGFGGAQAAAASSDSGSSFRAFQGQGRRLAD